MRKWGCGRNVLRRRMNCMKRTRVKVCCISSIAEAHLAVAHGVDALGLLGGMSTSPRAIDMKTAREIASEVPPAVETFLLTASFSGKEIARQAEMCGTTAIQVVQPIEANEHQRLAERLPNVRRVQAIHVEDRSALDLIDVYEPHVHAFVLDSGSAGASVGDLGGTGCVHDWSISEEFVRQTCKPVFLAGGLNADNVRRAISTVGPFGVDLCSGVRRNKKLDAHLLDKFTSNVWKAENVEGDCGESHGYCAE